MRIITGSTGTTHVTSNDDGEFNQGIFGKDLVVLENGNQLSAAIVDNNTIRVSDGDLVFQGRHALIAPNTTEDLTIETGTVGINRNDLIVARYVLDSATGYESITLEVLRGTETSGIAVDPAVTTGDIRTGALLAEVALYRVKIEGVNIVEIEPLFTVSKDVIELIANLQKSVAANGKSINNLDSNISTHTSNENNPHGVTKSQVGLGNVPNVATNNQTPTFSIASTLATLVSGEKLSVSMGKIMKAITDLINHIGNKSNPHGVTKAQLGLGNVNNTADSAKSVKYATNANYATTAGEANNLTGTLPISGGGTGGVSTSEACENLFSYHHTYPDYVLTLGSAGFDGSGGYSTLAELKKEMSLNNVNNTADSAKSVNHAITADKLLGTSSGTYIVINSSSNFKPYNLDDGSNNDNEITLGTSNARFKQLYAGTSTINTSDRNFKENIAELTDIHKQFFMKLIPVSFTFTDGESGRTHIGFISQDVEQAMSELGMTSLDFAGFCKDIKTMVKYSHVDVLDEDGNVVLDEDGNPTQKLVEEDVSLLDENGNVQYVYSLRYSEFIGLIAYVLQDTVHRMDSIEKRLEKAGL